MSCFDRIRLPISSRLFICLFGMRTAAKVAEEEAEG